MEEKGTKIKIKIKTAIKIRKNSSPPTKPISSTLILRDLVEIAATKSRMIIGAQEEIKNVFTAAKLVILTKCAGPFMFLKMQISKTIVTARNLEVEADLEIVLGAETSKTTIQTHRRSVPGMLSSIRCAKKDSSTIRQSTTKLYFCIQKLQKEKSDMIWKTVERMFKDKGPVSHQIDSFNRFITFEMANIINEFPEIEHNFPIENEDEYVSYNIK